MQSFFLVISFLVVWTGMLHAATLFDPHKLRYSISNKMMDSPNENLYKFKYDGTKVFYVTWPLRKQIDFLISQAKKSDGLLKYKLNYVGTFSTLEGIHHNLEVVQKEVIKIDPSAFELSEHPGLFGIKSYKLKLAPVHPPFSINKRLYNKLRLEKVQATFYKQHFEIRLDCIEKGKSKNCVTRAAHAQDGSECCVRMPEIFLSPDQ